MKICWDNLEGFRYNRKLGKWHNKIISWVYKESCKECHKEIHQIPGCGYNDMKCKEKIL